MNPIFKTTKDDYTRIGDFFPEFRQWFENEYPGVQLITEGLLTEKDAVLQTYRDITRKTDEGLRWIMLSQIRLEHKQTKKSIVVHQILNTNRSEWPLLVSYGGNVRQLSKWKEETLVYFNDKEVAHDFITFVNETLEKSKALKSFQDALVLLHPQYNETLQPIAV